MRKKNHKEEFFKYANMYDRSAQIQKMVAKELVGKIKSKPQKILDLGSGTGAVFKNLSWDYKTFIGVDCSKSMCELHPIDDKVKIICLDFESQQLQEQLNAISPFDIVVSSSSLQWAQDLKPLFVLCHDISKKVAFSIFTSGTFKTIYDLTKRESFLPKVEDIEKMALEVFDVKIEVSTYRLYFKDNFSKFKYIKESGIGGGSEVLSHTKIKRLIKEYPLEYLEFEVAFILN